MVHVVGFVVGLSIDNVMAWRENNHPAPQFALTFQDRVRRVGSVRLAAPAVPDPLFYTHGASLGGTGTTIVSETETFFFVFLL